MTQAHQTVRVNCGNKVSESVQITPMSKEPLCSLEEVFFHNGTNGITITRELHHLLAKANPSDYCSKGKDYCKL